MKTVYKHLIMNVVVAAGFTLLLVSCGFGSGNSVSMAVQGIHLDVAAVQINAAPANHEVSYIDVMTPLENKGSSTFNGELAVALVPARDRQSLGSWLRTKVVLQPGATNTVKSMMSLVRPREIKNGDPVQYVAILMLNANGSAIERAERTFTVAF